MNHFKGHEQAGFGGALKNLGMGSASVGGKMELHCSSQPRIDAQACTGCGMCEKYCKHHAISMISEADSRCRKASIDYTKCVGCGQCVAVCQHNGAVIGNSSSAEELNYKIAEYAKAVIMDKPNFHINFIMNVSPECDCWNHNDAAIVPDLGIAASFDPVALDCACADIVNAAPAIPAGNRLADIMQEHEHHKEDHDKFHHIHPDTCWQAGISHGEKIGIGSHEYELVRI